MLRVFGILCLSILSIIGCQLISSTVAFVYFGNDHRSLLIGNGIGVLAAYVILVASILVVNQFHSLSQRIAALEQSKRNTTGDGT